MKQNGAQQQQQRHVTRVNTPLEVFLAKELDDASGHLYAYENCIVDTRKRLPLSKYAFRLLVVCSNRLFVTDNPPKVLDDNLHVCFEDIRSIQTLDDVPRFLSGTEQDNALHIRVTYMRSSGSYGGYGGRSRGSRDSSSRKGTPSVSATKNRVLALKRAMLYAKTLDDKQIESELNKTTPRTDRSSNLASLDSMRSFRCFSARERFDATGDAKDIYDHPKQTVQQQQQQQQLTSRTNKSVHFDDYADIERDDLVRDTSRSSAPPEETLHSSSGGRKETDPLAREATNRRYATLVALLNRSALVTTATSHSSSDSDQMAATINRSHLSDTLMVGDGSGDFSPFSLSLPLTPRSLDFSGSAGNTTGRSDHTVASYVSKQQSRSLESLSHQFNADFIADCEKKESQLDFYVLNPQTNIFETLVTAHFYAKLKTTLNYHTVDDTDCSLFGEKDAHREAALRLHVEKKFRQLKSEMTQHKDDLDALAQLYDELLRATYTNTSLKRHFWKKSDMFKLTASELLRYLPKSPANMKTNKSTHRRIKELEVCIAFIETLSIMFQETEFFLERNEHLYEQKCHLLEGLVLALINEPELPLIGDLLDQTKYEEMAQMEMLMQDLTLVSTVLLWEIMHLLAQNTWNNEHFNLDMFVKCIETSKSLDSFVRRLFDELSRILTGEVRGVVLTAQQTIVIFKLFNLLTVLIEKSINHKLRNLLRQHYQEEFKYYYSEDCVKLKCFDYYPIVDDLLHDVRKLEAWVL